MVRLLGGGENRRQDDIARVWTCREGIPRSRNSKGPEAGEQGANVPLEWRIEIGSQESTWHSEPWSVGTEGLVADQGGAKDAQVFAVPPSA